MASSFIRLRSIHRNKPSKKLKLTKQTLTLKHGGRSCECLFTTEMHVKRLIVLTLADKDTMKVGHIRHSSTHSIVCWAKAHYCLNILENMLLAFIYSYLSTKERSIDVIISRCTSATPAWLQTTSDYQSFQTEGRWGGATFIFSDDSSQLQVKNPERVNTPKLQRCEVPCDVEERSPRWVREMLRCSDSQSLTEANARLGNVRQSGCSFKHKLAKYPHVVIRAVNHSTPSEQRGGNSQQVRAITGRSRLLMHTQTPGIGDDGSRHLRAGLMTPQLRVLIAFWYGEISRLAVIST